MCEDVFNQVFILKFDMDLYKLSTSSWVSFCNLGLSKNLLVLSKLSNYWHNLLITFPYYYFCNVYRICSDVPLTFQLLEINLLFYGLNQSI